MRKVIRSVVAAVVLIAAFGLVPSHAGAVGYEDSLDDCAYPKVFDGLVLKPLGFGATVVGGAVAVLSAPLYPLMHRDIGQFWHTLLAPPVNFTFVRRLGECSSGSVY